MTGSVDKTFEEDDFDPLMFAQSLLLEYHFMTMRDNEVLYVYDQAAGVYSPYGEQTIKEKMAYILKKDNRAHFYPDIIFHVKGSTYTDRPEIDPGKLVLKNGVLNLETMTLDPFSFEEFHLIQVPVLYDPAAECPTILEFLSKVVGEKQIALIQEVFGYCLYQRYLFHVALMLVGNGKNGKSTLLNLLTEFLGRKNVSHQSLQSLCNNRFSQADLYDKLANTCADIPSTPLTQTGNFKTLTGGDPVSVEKKYRDSFTMTNKAKLLFSCNKVPETKDDTDAFFRRWAIIVCNNVFVGRKCDPKILGKLTTEQELSGLLNWALEGLKRLLATEKFTANEDIEEQRKEYIRKSNSGKAFIEECLQYSPSASDFIPESDLYQKYILFCQENELPSSRKSELTQNIHQYLPQGKQTVERIAGKNVHVWQYITLATSATTSLPNFSQKIEDSENREEKDQTPVAVVAESKSEQVTPSQDVEVCGHCANWHRPGCSFPESDYSCVNPLNLHAVDCRDFILREDLKTYPG